MEIRELYKKIESCLAENGIYSPEAEARFMVCDLMNISDTDFYLYPDLNVTREQYELLIKAMERRISGEPLQYILGSWDFMGNKYLVGKGVLIPRPETELLCELVAKETADNEDTSIFDLCSGSGCIGITLQKLLPQSRVYLVEKSLQAVDYLRQNVMNICDGKKPVVIVGDVLYYDAFYSYSPVDVIVSNPPYIRSDEISTLQKEVSFEPEMALDGGEDGLKFYRYIINNWKNKLKPDGRFYFEIGEDQGGAVSKLLEENGFDSCVIKDYNNLDRIVTGRKILDVV